MPGALNRERELALMLRTGSGYPAGNDLSLLGSELHEALLILVVDIDFTALAEPADFSFLDFFYR